MDGDRMTRVEFGEFVAQLIDDLPESNDFEVKFYPQAFMTPIVEIDRDRLTEESFKTLESRLQGFDENVSGTRYGAALVFESKKPKVKVKVNGWLRPAPAKAEEE